MRYAPDTITLKTRSGQGQDHSDPKMVCDTPSSQDAFTHQIWNSYLKEYWSRGQVHSHSGMRHFIMPRCIITSNLKTLPQKI